MAAFRETIKNPTSARSGIFYCSLRVRCMCVLHVYMVSMVARILCPGIFCQDIPAAVLRMYVCEAGYI